MKIIHPLAGNTQATTGPSNGVGDHDGHFGVASVNVLPVWKDPPCGIGFARLYLVFLFPGDDVPKLINQFLADENIVPDGTVAVPEVRVFVNIQQRKVIGIYEKRNTFFATVVTANHKIKQPLTLLSLSSAAIKRELKKDKISKETMLSKTKYIDVAIKEISDVLDQLNAIKEPILSDYTKNIKMIKIDEGENGKQSD